MTVREPIWLTYNAIVSLQLDQTRQHGGLQGIRDDNALRSALDRSRNAFVYGGERDNCALAAAYAFGLERNHPFKDGNKRIGFVAMAAFLLENGMELMADEADVVTTMLNLAAEDLSEAELTEWVRQHVRIDESLESSLETSAS